MKKLKPNDHAGRLERHAPGCVFNTLLSLPGSQLERPPPAGAFASRPHGIHPLAFSPLPLYKGEYFHRTGVCSISQGRATCHIRSKSEECFTECRICLSQKGPSSPSFSLWKLRPHERNWQGCSQILHTLFQSLFQS